MHGLFAIKPVLTTLSRFSQLASRAGPDDKSSSPVKISELTPDTLSTTNIWVVVGSCTVTAAKRPCLRDPGFRRIDDLSA